MPYESREAWIDTVRQAVDIVEVVGRSVVLKRKGRHWWGLCPFHAEKTPSFSVDPEQQLFYCFGCHKGGTVFTFLMQVEGREFKEVIEGLAQEVGVLRPDDHLASRSDPHQRMRAIMEWTQEYFAGNFRRHADETEEYLEKRGVDLTVGQRFMLGYAPDSWHGLIDVLKRRGVSLEEMVQAGVAILRERGGAYDRWRGRLMFPIWDRKGSIIAFGGRALLPDQEPKYLNSPDTDLFHKGQLLYADHLARPSWRKGKAPLLVEGYFDVMACHQAGLTQAIGQLGTALSETQARYLARFSREVDLLLDQDGAGHEAMRRAFLTLSAMGLKVNVITLDDGVKDPSELVARDGTEALVVQVNRRRPYVEHQIYRLGQSPDALSPRGRAEVVEQLKPLVAAIQDSVEQIGYVEVIARVLHVHPGILTQSFGSLQGSRHTIRKNRHNMEVTVSVSQGVPPLEVRLLAALKSHPDQIERVRKMLPEWANETSVRLILEELALGQLKDPGVWTRTLADPKVESLLVAIWQYQEPDGGNAAIDDLVNAMEHRQDQDRWHRLMDRARQGELSPELMDDIRSLGKRMGQYPDRKEG